MSDSPRKLPGWCIGDHYILVSLPNNSENKTKKGMGVGVIPICTIGPAIFKVTILK